jgi:hypothetical protein
LKLIKEPESFMGMESNTIAKDSWVRVEANGDVVLMESMGYIQVGGRLMVNTQLKDTKLILPRKTKCYNCGSTKFDEDFIQPEDVVYVCVNTIRERVSETDIFKIEQRDDILLLMKFDAKLICHKASDVYFSCLQKNTEETCNTQYIKT